VQELDKAIDRAEGLVRYYGMRPIEMTLALTALLPLTTPDGSQILKQHERFSRRFTR
jgi:hypothetical protein